MTTIRALGIVEECVELTDEDILTDDGGGGRGIIARNGIFQVAGRFLLSGLAFECKVLFKWHHHRARSSIRSLARLFVRSLRVSLSRLSSLVVSPISSSLFHLHRYAVVAPRRGLPLGQEASFPDIQMRSNIIPG